MDVRAARGDERMLRRVIVLLVSFAVLAERVAGRSLAVRFLVLWILRRAETTAADLVFEQSGLPIPVLEGFASVGNDPDDALRLAARFHALAAALSALLPDRWRFRRGPARRGFAFGAVAQASAPLPGNWTREPFDTS